MTAAEYVGWFATALTAAGLIMVVLGQSSDIAHLHEAVAKAEDLTATVGNQTNTRIDEILAILSGWPADDGTPTITDLAPATQPVPIITPALGEHTRDQAKVLIDHWARPDTNTATRRFDLPDGSSHTFAFRGDPT